MTRSSWGALLPLLLAACANPVPPSGGPPDTTPPGIVEATPDTNAVNVTDGLVRWTFSEGVDQGSFARALTITPEPESPPEIAWHGRTVEVRLEALRPNTTYVLTLDNTLRDLRGVTLREPLTRAFSTGPTLNRGRIAGKVLAASTGQGVANADVLAYALRDTLPPQTLPARPDYRTQTDPEGGFRFDFLGEVPFFIVVLEDRNRNRRLDPGEPFAVPPHPFLRPDTASVEIPWLLSLPDTLGPRAERVRSYSPERHAVRYDEVVHLTSRALDRWTLRDTLGNVVPLQTLYTRRDEPRQVFFSTPPLAPIPHRLDLGAVGDSAGNRSLPSSLGFTPSTARDTLQLRFLGFLPPDGLLAPDEQPGLHFNAPPDTAMLRSMLTVTDTLGAPLSLSLTTEDGTTYRLETAPPPLRVILDARELGRDMLDTLVFRSLPTSDLGGVAGVVEGTGPIFIELVGQDGRGYRATADPQGRFSLSMLPPGNYRLRVHVDRDGDGTWDHGQIAPYRPPERLLFRPEEVNVRARWESALSDTLRVR